MTRLIMSFIVACLLVVVWGISCIVIVPVILLLLALLPFACISILVEAWWRIRHNRPYIAPPVVIRYDDIAPSIPPQSAGDWLVPLVIGLWIGSTWGKDD